jgi:Arylsulfotransferase (ASST)
MTSPKTERSARTARYPSPATGPSAAPPPAAPPPNSQLGSADDRSSAASRRDFLRYAAGAVSAGTGLALTACGSSSAHTRTVKEAAAVPSALPRFRSRRGGIHKGGVQHLRSLTAVRPPQIHIDHRASGTVPGVVLTDAHGGPAQQGPLIFDSNGRVVWFKPLPKGVRAFNLRVQSYKGQPVVTWFEGAVISAHGVGHYEIYDQQYRQVAQVHGGNGYHGDLHEFMLTDRGTALFTCYGKAVGKLPVAGGTRRGPYFYGVVQEVDIATGKVVFEWRSDHHIPFSASYTHPPSKAGNSWDYFHINSICIDPADQNLIISSRNTWAVYKIDRKNGKVLWKLGGKGSNFKMGAHTHFAFQHHVTLHPGGILTLFDNEGGPPNESSQSRGLLLSINEKSRRATIRNQYFHHPRVLSMALGSVQELDQGHRFIGWGTSSYFTEYGSRGQVLFDGRLTAGVSSYRAFKDTWNATPAQAPNIAADRSGSHVLLHVSWNGATDVAHWGILGGSDAGSLRQIGTASVAGFETQITVPNAPAVLSVQALDGSGKVLGRSPSVHA